MFIVPFTNRLFFTFSIRYLTPQIFSFIDWNNVFFAIFEKFRWILVEWAKEWSTNTKIIPFHLSVHQTYQNYISQTWIIMNPIHFFLRYRVISEASTLKQFYNRWFLALVSSLFIHYWFFFFILWITCTYKYVYSFSLLYYELMVWWFGKEIANFLSNVRVFAYAFDDASIFQVIAHIKAIESSFQINCTRRWECWM